MKLDTEQDRQALLGLIQNATIKGEAVLMVADLTRRIQAAEIVERDKPDAHQPSADEVK